MQETNLNLEELLNDGKVLEERTRMFSIDEERAFRKLSEFQFDNPYDAFRELVANAIDSYVPTDREVKVEVVNACTDETRNAHEFRIKDYGIGLNDERIAMLTTLGLSEKIENRRDYIGRFGIGFATLFHPKIGAEDVTVDTNNNGKHEQLCFAPSADNTIPSLKRYSLDDHINYGTEIVLRYKGKEKAKKIDDVVRRVLTFLPHQEVFFNGEKVKRRSIKTRKTQVTTPFWYGDTLRGHLTLRRDGTEGTIHLLSKGLYVESHRTGSFITSDRIPVNIDGVIDSATLNLTISRNEVVRDEEFSRVRGMALLVGEDLRKAITEKYAATGDERLRHEIIRMMGRPRWKMKDYHFNEALKREILERDRVSVTRGIFSGLEDLQVFRAFDEKNLLSLIDIVSVQKERGYSHGNLHKIVFACNDTHIEEVRNAGYDGLIILVESGLGYYGKKVQEGYEKGERSFGNHIEDLLRALSPHSSFSLDEHDTETLKMMCSQGLCDFERLFFSYILVPDEVLTPNQRTFIQTLRNLAIHPSVIDVFRRYGLEDKVEIGMGAFSGGKKQSVIACYHSKKHQMAVNKDSAIVQRYTESGNPDIAALYFVPTFAHEITHQEVLGHGEAFFKKKERFERELKIAIANSVGAE